MMRGREIGDVNRCLARGAGGEAGAVDQQYR